MRAPRPVALCALLAVSTAASPRAQAEASAEGSADGADTQAREARSLYDQGRYEQAVSAYLRAFRLSPSAGYLYNVAVIYDRKLNEPTLAMDFYRRYIVADDADPSAVERATARIKALKSQVAEATPEPPPPKPKPKPEPAVSEQAPERESAQPSTSGRRVAAFTLIGVGGAALLGGAALGYLAYTAQGKYESAETEGDKKNMQSLGRSEALAGDILMGGGLVLAGVGTALLLTGGAPAPKVRSSAETEGGADAEPSTGLNLMPLPGGLALTLGGRL